MGVIITVFCSFAVLGISLVLAVCLAFSLPASFSPRLEMLASLMLVTLAVIAALAAFVIFTRLHAQAFSLSRSEVKLHVLVSLVVTIVIAVIAGGNKICQ